jgi:hypothetical protein
MIQKHLLPQSVIDCVEKMLTDKKRDTRLLFQQRVETIKEFCEQALVEFNKKNK